MASINTVYSVTMDQHDPEARMVHANVTDYFNETYDCEYCTRPVDELPPSMNTLFQEWLILNNGSYTVLPYVAPPPQPFNISISAMWGLMTDLEAEAFDTAMAVAPPLRLRKQFQTSQSFMSNSELYPFVEGVLTTSISAQRAGEILVASSMNNSSMEVL